MGKGHPFGAWSHVLHRCNMKADTACYLRVRTPMRTFQGMWSGGRYTAPGERPDGKSKTGVFTWLNSMSSRRSNSEKKVTHSLSARLTMQTLKRLNQPTKLSDLIPSPYASASLSTPTFYWHRWSFDDSPALMKAEWWNPRLLINPTWPEALS